MTGKSRVIGLLAPTLLVMTLVAGCGSPAAAPPVLDSAAPTPTSDAASAPPTTPPPTTAAAVSSSSAARPAAEDWPGTVREVQSGVARITVALCDGSGLGTGFLIAEDLVVTAAHVVKGEADIAIAVGGQIVSADVLGSDDQSDLALLSLSRPVRGYLFSFVDRTPEMGANVAALGYPMLDDLTFTQGRISGLNRSADNGTDVVRNLIQTDAAINPGNSGGPLLLLDGSVAGVVSGKRAWVHGTGGRGDHAAEGTAYAVDAAVAVPQLSAWTTNDAPLTSDNCSVDGVPGAHTIDITIDAGHERANDLAQTLLTHGQAINGGIYDVAFDAFTPRQQQAMGGLEQWRAGLSTSFWTALALRDVTATDTGLRARVTLQTEQSSANGPQGQTCSRWTIDYSMVKSDRAWLIDGALSKDPGGIPTPC